MISQNILQFLEELSNNNNKEWFHANKEKYRKARLEFENIVGLIIHEISRFDNKLQGLAPKDCVFRIFRDIRFSNDKTPYKTNFGAYMVKGGRKSGFAGYYLHVEPRSYFLAGGVYMPPAPVLKAIRNEIYNNTEEFKEIIGNKVFKTHFGNLWGEKLTAPPRGFSKDFPDIELLKYKHYIVSKDLNDNQVKSKDFIPLTSEIFEAMAPFNKFLNQALEGVL